MIAGLFSVLLAMLAAPVFGQCGAGSDIPDNTIDAECVVTFDRRYEQNYRRGEPYDYVTIRPDGGGETFADMGIHISVRLFCHLSGEPVTDFPATRIVLFNSNLCFCDRGLQADGPTDAGGWTEFSGSIPGGGCAQGLDLFVDGLFIRTIPVNINSTDIGGNTSPCATDAGDLAVLATLLGDPARYSICFDYNESGPPAIDASDLAFFASTLASRCQ